ncbi:SKP1-like protein 21 [Lotus japonicus]|uniref:SKP1-like protein 21 n=1 Tax=Lotus japonicus TaxID=34305 RepID=UPI00258D742E|nr:SKP1-like protein 21 [Lotus japonicus]
MAEIDKGVIKPEMLKPYVWLQTSDGSIQQVEHEVATVCPLICQEIIHKGTGSSKNCAISLPQEVSPAMLSLILDYCRFHQRQGRSNKEKKSYDEKFIKKDTNQLFGLVKAADSLQLKSLVDLTSCAIARVMEGKSPEVIREMFHLPDDLTEEEKLEPFKNITDDPRIRLLNRLNAKKLKELKERESLKNVEVKDEHVDDRTVEDLLSFINGNDRDQKEIKTSKNKKKNRRKKGQQKFSSLKEASEPNKKEVNGHDIESQNAEADRFARNSNSHTEDDVSAHKEIDDDDIDDEIDPALKEKIDREVEDFARRLNSDWPERMQELLSSGQERNTMFFATNRTSFLRRAT